MLLHTVLRLGLAMMTSADDGETDGVVAPSHAAAVRRWLGEQILLGHMRPGEFLSEARIADARGVSRTPVREAIRMLAADGLVVLRPRQRAVVRGQTAAEILDQFEAMAELEASCARLAAQRRTAAELAEMRAWHGACLGEIETGDLASYYGANERFHQTIYAASGNSYLERETIRLRDRMRFLRITPGSLPGRLGASSREHGEVLDAITAADRDGAAAAMRRHLEVQGESIRTMLRFVDDTGLVRLPEIALDMQQKREMT